MSATFTPGPWWHEECGTEVEGANCYEICSETSFPIACVELPMADFAEFAGTLDAFNAGTLANAHLISAAPDLYDALDAVLSAIPPCDVSGSLREAANQASAALAKARGEA